MNQAEKYGITNKSLDDVRNNYGYLVGKLIEGVQLPPMESLELRFQVQAPVVTKNDILSFIATKDPSHFLKAKKRIQATVLPQQSGESGLMQHSLVQATNISPTDVITATCLITSQLYLLMRMRSPLILREMKPVT